jgi:ABC-type phosphate transport system substrate-binding protein
MKLPKTLGIVGAVVGAAMLAGPDPVFAQGGIPNCADLENPVYMTGTTAVRPVVYLLGARLKNVHLTLLWNDTNDGCGSVGAFLSTAVDTSTIPVYSYYQESGDATGKVIPFQCNAVRGKKADLVINDVAYSSCVGNPTLSGTTAAEFPGPVQGVVPIVPSSFFTYNDVMAEELQAIYFCGSTANILGLNPILNFTGTTSGLKELFARTIGFPASTAMGFTWVSPVDISSADAMVQNVSTGTTTLGYTSTEFYDQYRDRVNALKVRGVGQKLAYWPDSDKTSTDKLNIREGRYTLQGTLRLVTNVTGGVPTNPTVKNIIDWFQQNPVDPSLQLPFDITEIYAKGGVVPRCAMKVTNDEDKAVFKHFKPAQPCHCAFQLLATGKPSIAGCVQCTGGSAGAVDGGVADGGVTSSAGTCAANQICSHGYCEQP